MQRLEVSFAVRPIWGSLGVKWLRNVFPKYCRFPLQHAVNVCVRLCLFALHYRDTNLLKQQLSNKYVPPFFFYHLMSNILKPSGYFTYGQVFNFPKFRMALTSRLCVFMDLRTNSYFVLY